LIKRIAYTIGEPAGIGPDLAILLAQQADTQNKNQQLVAIADPDLMAARAKQLGVPLKLIDIHLSDEPTPLTRGQLGIIPIKSASPTQTGQLNSHNAQYVLNILDHAIDACQRGYCHAMVTGPVQKSVINAAGIAFSGHTEYLAVKTQTKRVVMMLATQGLRVALATTHIPLSKVAEALTPESLTATLQIINTDLQTKFGIDRPTILVCGLNPHAGEDGHLGREEIDIILPALDALKQQGLNCQGPLPADTLFTPKYLEHADIVLAMYHDQGLPVLKAKGFGAAANITLGLPIIRTSVDHGTALDLAGTGNINIGSLSTAIDYALQMQASEINRV